MDKSQALTAPQLRELTFELQVERARLNRVMAAFGVSDTDIGPMSAAEHGMISTFATPVLSGDCDARLDAIEAALERIEAGNYGSCTGCNHPIPFGRLIVMPEATHCVGCWPQSRNAA